MKERQVIHFAHGNGFPSLCYKKMLSQLKKDYDVFYIDKIGHDTDYPITENWLYLVDELIASIEKQAHIPVIAVGHSLGGILSFMASIKRPELFRAVIVLDSFFAGKLKLRIIQLLKYAGILKQLPSILQARKRRDYWENKLAVKNYLESKTFFKNFDPECLQDYIEYGIKQNHEGYYLEFDKEREYKIYCTMPHLFSLLHQQNPALKIPTALLYGNHSKIVRKKEIQAAKKYYHMLCFPTEGTHMFPLEHPLECAHKIKMIVKELL